MNIIKRSKTPFNTLVASILLLASSHCAFAAGTASDIDITNFATVVYNIGTVSQTPIDSATITFTVDAKVDFTVTSGSNTSVTPGSNDQGLQFTVQNDGNETYDFALAFAADAANPPSSVVTGLTFHLDAGGTWNSTAITKLENIPADGSAIVWLVGNIPLTVINAQTLTYHLITTALLENGSALPSGTNTDSPDTKQYVYADAQGSYTTYDALRDAKHSARVAFVVESANLTITKSSSVVWDPVNLSANPLYISGAIVEYTIQVSNSTGAETASDLSITDILDSNLIMPTAIPAELLPHVTGSSVALTPHGGSKAVLLDTATVSGQTVTVSGILLSGGQSATVNILAQIK